MIHRGINELFIVRIVLQDRSVLSVRFTKRSTVLGKLEFVVLYIAYKFSKIEDVYLGKISS